MGCPKCGSEDYDTNSIDMKINYHTIYDFECNKCGCKWDFGNGCD